MMPRHTVHPAATMSATKATGWKTWRGPAGFLLAALPMVLVPSSALAHASVHPAVAAPGAYERYVLRVPNERDVPTTRIEVRFPSALRIVSFGDVPGWRLEILTDSAQRFVGAVWTGELPAERFVEFPFVAVNPREEMGLVWPTIQTYAGGERIEWAGPEGSDQPAPATRVGSSGSEAAGGPGWAGWVAVAALALSLASIVMAYRRAVT